MGPVTGSNESKIASGVAAQPARKRLILGALCRCTPKGLAKISELREARYRQITDSRPWPDYADPPSEAGFCLWVLGRGPRRNRDRTRRIARTSRACLIITRPSTREAVSLAEKGDARLVT